MQVRLAHILPDFRVICFVFLSRGGCVCLLKLVKASASFKVTEGLGLVYGRYSNIIADKHATDSPIEVKLGLKSAFCDMSNDKWMDPVRADLLVKRSHVSPRETLD